jgi:hypothetical protein
MTPVAPFEPSESVEAPSVQPVTEPMVSQNLTLGRKIQSGALFSEPLLMPVLVLLFHAFVFGFYFHTKKIKGL